MLNMIQAQVSTPFLPLVNDNIYTLVLDLDETLIHFFYVNIHSLNKLLNNNIN